MFNSWPRWRNWYCLAWILVLSNINSIRGLQIVMSPMQAPRSAVWGAAVRHADHFGTRKRIILYYSPAYEMITAIMAVLGGRKLCQAILRTFPCVWSLELGTFLFFQCQACTLAVWSRMLSGPGLLHIMVEILFADNIQQCKLRQTFRNQFFPIFGPLQCSWRRVFIRCSIHMLCV